MSDEELKKIIDTINDKQVLKIFGIKFDYELLKKIYTKEQEFLTDIKRICSSDFNEDDLRKICVIAKKAIRECFDEETINRLKDFIFSKANNYSVRDEEINFGDVLSLHALWESFNLKLILSKDKELDSYQNNLLFTNYCQNGVCLYLENNNWHVKVINQGEELYNGEYLSCYEASIDAIHYLAIDSEEEKEMLLAFSKTIRRAYDDEIDLFIESKLKGKVKIKQ